ncbi:MAG TPA: amidohydrolase, partial [Mucilaginibacter sp.]
MIKEQIQELSQKIFDDVVANRRHLHANPELSFHELNTSVFVANKLEELGLEYHKMADTGLVALIKGDLPSDNVVALRADMDALPIT